MAQSRNITSLSGIDVVEFNHFPFVRRVEAEWQEDRSEIETCPECEAEDPKLHVKEWTERKLRDRPVGNKPLLIKLHCCRYECQECHCSFQPEHPGLRADSTLTQALFEHLCKRSVGTETHKEIARATGTHESTVRKCLRLQRRKMDARSNSTTPVAGALGVDKVHVGKGDALVVVASLLGHRKSVAEVLPDASENGLCYMSKVCGLAK
jgi:transposase